MGWTSALNVAVSPQELQDIVDRYGEDPAWWPADTRIPAQELIDVSAEARLIVEQARRLRSALLRMGPEAPACFTDRILSVALELDPPLDESIPPAN
jgi:hypothetical protein